VKVSTRQSPAVQRTEAPKAKTQTEQAKPKAPARDLPRADQAEKKLQGERAGDHKALASLGAGVFDVQERGGVQKLCERYGVECSGRGEERMLTNLQALDQSVRAKDPIAALGTHDTRRAIFRLEGLLRLYGKELPVLQPALGKVKALEDVIGDYTKNVTTLAAATKDGAPPKVLHEMEKVRDESLEVVKTMVEKDWAVKGDGRSDGVQEIIKHLDKADFGSDEHDRKFVAKALASHVEHIRDEHYSMRNLSDGVHALRRQLRWTVLYTEAMDGTVQLGPVKHEDSSYVKVLGHKDLEKLYEFVPYAPAKEGETPIELPKELYAGLQKSTYDLGVIKDDVEAREAMEEAYKKAGFSKSDVEDVMGDKGTVDDMEKRATQVHDLMKSEHLLKRVQHAFEEG
jgi:hypothetical protein